MVSVFKPGSAAEPTLLVDLTISCRNLPDCDVFSKSDPMCVIYLKTQEKEKWHEICRTEAIKNNLNPDFTTKVRLEYRFEIQQNLRFEVYDIDSTSLSLVDHDFLGYCESTLGHLVSNVNAKLPLKNQYNKGLVLVTSEECGINKDEVTLKFHGRNLDRKDWFGSSDPFLEFWKVFENGEYKIVHRSEVVKWNLNPHWKTFTLPVYTLCGNDNDRDILVKCYDWNRSGNHSFIGECHVTMAMLSKGPGPATVFHLINSHKKHKPHYRHSGELVLTQFSVRTVYSFLDYIMSGTQINCSVAIDFTASNGDPAIPNSLHFISNRPNSYELALSAVVEIIQDYHSTKQFPVLGFGARLPPDGRTSHEFYVNLHPTDPYCQGVQGVLEAYQKCIRQVQLYGPTNFSPVINHVARFAATYTDGSQYFILLIVTDGVITDMEHTKAAIVAASYLPMSIIIVGVGEADFSAMEELDADSVPLMLAASLVLVITWTTSQVYAGCETTTPIDTLNIKQLEGKWYRLLSFGTFTMHRLSRCHETKITANSDGKGFTMDNDRIARLINTHYTSTWSVKTKSDKPSGDLTFKSSMPIIGSFVTMPLKVLGTDYKNYLILHVCREFAYFFRYSAGYVLTRKRNYEAKELESIYSSIDEILKKNGLNRSQFTLTNQTDCEAKSLTDLSLTQTSSAAEGTKISDTSGTVVNF
ncbi:copine-8-like [Macrosteles quadrilineatus]|uniref:copine-8-like n=1 Tax=Macrosteles quadrilineatus TaxID=74068 RepID=UPI0023E187F5|nr:copine-8-like [Macrosteles quadrilineatus]